MNPPPVVYENLATPPPAAEIPDNSFTICLPASDNSIPPKQHSLAMKMHFCPRGILLSGLIALSILASNENASAESTPPLAVLCRDAVSKDPSTAATAINALRERGPDGLSALLSAYEGEITQHAGASRPMFGTPKPDEPWTRLRTALDNVGQQRDCFASHLFWYTDFEKAKIAAQAQHKPILSLRLLGKLNEEFSCANSRFFRTTLYANAEVAAYLRDHFILHWKSVRPVPRVTIDFGDGRKLERTITGNSIHYVLSPDGAVVDALPGLYGAKAFLRELQRAEVIAERSVAASSSERQSLLTTYHKQRLQALTEELERDLQKVAALPDVAVNTVSLTPAILRGTPPRAQLAAIRATSKGGVERPILNRTATTPTVSSSGGSAALDDSTWQKIATLHAEDATLDPGAKSLIRAKGPNAIEASRVALSKSFVEDPLLRKMRAMQRSISEDTVRNEYVLHRQIHEWLATQETPPVDQLNARIYAELFLTPNSDPWLGLLPPDAYAALENDGLSLNQKP